MDGAPGNCGSCVKHHRDNADRDKQLYNQQRLAAANAGLAILPKRQFDARPPCRRCPKWKLFPANWGLHPANEVIVQMYRQAAEDQRVGTMAGAFLVNTLPYANALAVVEQHAHHFPTWLHREKALELLIGLGRVATQVRQEAESVEMKRAQADAEAKAKRSARPGG